jgi:hypothetical protein
MMDAVEYLKTLRRMCSFECSKCEIWKRLSALETCTVWRKNHPEEAVAIAEQWAAEHPAKTRQSEFLKLFPGAAPTKDGVIAICPNAFSPVYKDERGLCKWHYAECDNCCREFWLAEVE